KSNAVVICKMFPEEVGLAVRGLPLQGEPFYGKAVEKASGRPDGHPFATGFGPGKDPAEQRGQVFSKRVWRIWLQEEIDLRPVRRQAGASNGLKTARVHCYVARLIEVPGKKRAVDLGAKREHRPGKRYILCRLHDATMNHPVCGMAVATERA